MFDALEEGLSAHSLSGETLYVNSRMLEMLGKAGSEIIGQSCEQVFHEEHCPHQEALDTNSRIKIRGRFQASDTVYSLTISPMRDRYGKAIGYLRIVHDISESERAQEELLKAEHFATLGQMVSGIAHDVGTPLNIISGYSEYLLMKAGPEGKGQKELTTIIQQTRRIADFIKQMLYLARPAHGRKDAIELKGFLSDSIELMGSHLRKANVRASIKCESSSPVIYGDGAQLRQAIFNLIINAVQDVGEGGELSLIVDEPADRSNLALILISGRESGGIAHDFSDAFSGLLLNGKQSGARGMGLLLAREILKDLNASIEFIKEGEQGTSLALLLPKGQSETAQS
jgi:PAS domain S-box-containing protein